MDTKKGFLYLIPTTLGDNEPLEVLPINVKEIIEKLDYFIVENEKTARRFIKRLLPTKNQQSLRIFKIDKYANPEQVKTYLNVCDSGVSIGLMSEAGVPAIADPGAEVVKNAHFKKIRVIPLVGPSSILLAMMASGLNGQNFAFNGYLPIDAKERKWAIKDFERISKDKQQSQIFIETPYRNEKLFTELKNTLALATKLCVACDITLPTEYIKTLSISEWNAENPDLHKKPTIFIIHKF